MKALAINGSPRRGANTATMLRHALAGAASRGAETKLVHLRDLSFSGCASCFACKRKGARSEGRCALRDGATALLDEALGYARYAASNFDEGEKARVRAERFPRECEEAYAMAVALCESSEVRPLGPVRRANRPGMQRPPTPRAPIGGGPGGPRP